MLVLALAATGLHNCHAAPEDWEDTGKYGKNIKFLSDLLEEHRKEGRNHPLDGFIAKHLYRENNVKDAWNEKCSGFTGNVVRINCVYKTNEGICLPYIGTGTLIDTGSRALKGRVVITCAHNVIDVDVVSVMIRSRDHYVMQRTGNDKFFRKQRGILTNNAYISVTPEPEQLENLPLVNTEQNAEDAPYKVKRAYFYRKNGVMSDLAILILDNPVTDGSKTLSGEIISPDTICGSKERDATSVLDYTDFYIIGYGMTGFRQLPGAMGDLSEAVRENQLEKRQDLLQRLGWNKKKRIAMRKELLPDRCIYRTFTDVDYAGGGFSGSLIVSQSMTGGPIKYAGIYSGPVFKLSNETGSVAADGSDLTVAASPVDICEFIEFVKDQESRQPQQSTP
jgi:hypothetical protein